MSAPTPNPLPADPSRFSVRMSRLRWLVLTSAVLLIGSIALSVWRPYHLEQQAVREIQFMGGDVELEVAAPEWLRQIAGYERLENLKFFNRVNDVDLTGSKVADAELRSISGLKSLDYLSLAETPITDAGLVHLAGLPSLTKLHLDGTQITDAGLLHLRGLTTLEWLELDDTKITDAGLAHLDALAHLAILTLDETSITDAGLARLSGFRKLISLSVRKTLITDGGVEDFYRALPTCQLNR